MTHDPLCSVVSGCDTCGPYTDELCCECPIINKTRKATQDEIATRVNSLAMDYILGKKYFGETADWLDSWNDAVLGNKS